MVSHFYTNLTPVYRSTLFKVNVCFLFVQGSDARVDLSSIGDALAETPFSLNPILSNSANDTPTARVRHADFFCVEHIVSLYSFIYTVFDAAV